MKKQFASRILFIAGFVILVLTNIFVLSGVASNRSGEPDTLIVLTERELRLKYRDSKENSGLALGLYWRVLSEDGENLHNYAYRSDPAWLDADKLEALGFNINRYLAGDSRSGIYRRLLSKEVFIVLENGGEPCKESLRRAQSAFAKVKKAYDANLHDEKQRFSFERAKERLYDEQVRGSHLFAIDAGLDPAQLRKKYADRSRFIILKGLVRPYIPSEKVRDKVSGYITKISTIRINVPLKHRRILDAVKADGPFYSSGITSPRYKVKLAVGSRYEPWIISVEKIEPIQ